MPDCRREVRWFVLPSRLPQTRDAASYRAEELLARCAVADFTDAAVGRPDRGALERGARALEAAAATVSSGSQRINLDDLGPVVGAPSLGRVAARLGQRVALLAHPDRWRDWSIRVDTLRAALAEGDVGRAISIASRYAELDPRDEDLRTSVAALLCLGEGEAPKRGLEMLTLTQNDRASRRYAGMSRDWGGVRAVIVACAARAGATPPPRPERPEAGADDAVEVSVALRARLAADAAAADPRRAAIDAARDLLRSATPRMRARAGLLALVLDGDEALDAAAAAELTRPPADEGVAAPAARPAEGAWAISPLAMDWLPRPGLDAPVLAGPALSRAAARAAALAADPGLSTEQRADLRAAAAGLAFRAARELALAGDARAAVAALDGVVHEGAAAAPLARSSAWYVAGDPARALAALDAAPPPPDAPPAARGATLLQRAEVLASLGRAADAGDAAARAEDLLAEAAAMPAGVAPPGVDLPRAAARARWTRLALVRAPAKGAPAVTAPVPLRGADSPWPWVGFARPDAPWARADQRAFSIALTRWGAARAAPPNERRALRYAALGRRGDAPMFALVAYVAAAADLLGDGEGDAEVWLDAFLALDARRTSLRGYAFARAEAARWRGDAAAADAWRRRYEALRAVASTADTAEVARFLRL